MQAFEQFIVHGWKLIGDDTLEFSYSFDEQERFHERIVFPFELSNDQVEGDNCEDIYEHVVRYL